MKTRFKGTGKKRWFPEGKVYEVSTHHDGDEKINDEDGVDWWHPAETKHLVKDGYITEVKTPDMEENE